ncbi:LysR family transcriptional regulator [Gordonia jinhuaensis]|uniref:Transcriptional regulator, LysR family protein n=1 Tax=Gordonia jinhuaensis TaxID=1517702 RepID=A0A916X0V2_9ACTN|nr:LysR family transcriptional regulator [Gordonia jinhuaensis]GGB44769.1 putative transcriptional regulator, LysR family protein [Gordonia jinhuaensis]
MDVRLDLRRLEVLREFADRGSVAGVAQALHMTPSAVSQQLKALAKEAGVEVVEPVGRRIRLTAAGEALVVRADEILAAVQRAADEMAGYRGGTGGRVRVAMFPSGAALLAPGMLTRLAAEGIAAEIADFDVSYPDASSGLTDHDLVVTHRDELAARLSRPRVKAVELMREPLDVVVAADHPLAQAGSVQVADLADADWISVRGGFPVDDVLMSIATITGVAPRITQRLLDFTTIEAMVAAGHGIALMPRHAVRNPHVRPLVLAGVRAARVYEVLVRPQAQRRTTISQAIEALRAEAASIDC